MASFWFEERATERYYSMGVKTKKVGTGKNAYEYEETDWSTEEPRTREEFEAYIDGGYKGRSIYRQGDQTELQRVDELICEFMGDPKPDRNRDSEWYWMCHEIGFQTLYNKGGSWIGDQDDHLPYLHERFQLIMEQALKKDPEHYSKRLTEGYQARAHALIDWVFVTKWRFHTSG